MKAYRIIRRLGLLALILALLLAASPISARAASFSAVVVSSKMIVREGPSASTKLLGYLSKGTVVTVHEYKNGIAYIEYKGNKGYALVSDMERLEDKKASLSGLGTVTSSSLKVYASASTASKVIGTLKRGATITVLSTDGDWAKLQNGTHIGYAKTSGLSIDTKASATPTPKPNVSLSGLGKVTASSIKVYESASTTSKVLGTLKRGATITVLSTDGDWAKLQNGVHIGYAKISGLSIDTKASATPTPTPTPSPTPEVITNPEGPEAACRYSSIYVYEKASTSSTKLGLLRKDQTVIVLESNDTWSKVYRDGNVGYAKTAYLRLTGNYAGGTATPTPSPTPSPSPTPDNTNKVTGPEAICRYTSINVFSEATSSSALLYKLKKNESVIALDKSGNYTKIFKDGIIGYAWTEYLNFTGKEISLAGSLSPELSPTPGITQVPGATQSPTLPVTVSIPAFANVDNLPMYEYAALDSAIVSSISVGKEITVLGYDNTWALADANSKRGYVLIDNIKSIADVTIPETTRSQVKVTATKLLVYKYASENTEYLGHLNKNTVVTLLGQSGDWALLERDGKKGCALISGLDIAPMPTLPETVRLDAEISAGTAPTYAYAWLHSESLVTLAHGTPVTLLGYDDEWALIEAGGKKCYTPVDNIVLVNYPTLTENESIAAVVSALDVPMYEYASDKSKRLATLKDGTKTTVLAHDGTWALISYNGARGYVKQTNLKVEEDEFISPTICDIQATVVKADAPVYEKSLETAKTIGNMNAGAQLRVTGYTDKWARVVNGGKTGYMLKKHLNNDEYTELKSGNASNDNVLKLQKALEDLGYFDGSPAGNFGSLTLSAVKRFQTSIGVTATGAADVITQRVLYGGFAPASPIVSANLKLNDVGGDVTRLQTRLTYKGYFASSLDGEYGPITQAAVKLYQEKAGITTTGTADSATLKSLFSSSAPKNSGAPASTGGNGGGSTDPGDDPGIVGSTKVETVIEYALAQLGKPYVYATAGPNTFDCSGFTKYCYGKVGVSLRRSAQSVGYNDGTKISSISDLKRGDIVCFNTVSDNDLSDHVGIYLGDGKFVHASSSAAKVVISSLSSGYYKTAFSWGRRVL